MIYPKCARVLFVIPTIIFWMSSGLSLAVEGARVSDPIASVLREPLPPEKLACSETDAEVVVEGPTFSYRVTKGNGAIASLRAVRDGAPVIESTGPADIVVDGYRMAGAETSGTTRIAYRGDDRVVLETEGALKPADTQGSPLLYWAKTTFFNDGVAVVEVRLRPEQDFAVRDCIQWQGHVRGRFGNYLHKRRDEDGQKCAFGKLPAANDAVRFATMTSCLQVSSPEAALAIFTDSGAVQSSEGLDTAVVNVKENGAGTASLGLSQYVVHVQPGAPSFVLKAGTGLSFRVGISLAPHRLPHRRTQDLRLFTWIGDARYPYPTDDEIWEAARLGYTVYQLHRAGTPGEPRPPAGEFERVLKTVHDAGMLYVCEENADLLYGIAPGVVAMKAEGKWPLWEGFNYGGHYTAPMDPYCDLVGTCLASPNGLAEYRQEYLNRMMDRYAVDGIYLDDNLPYANCTLWKEHGHPQPVYDCLIELHEMNWKRREILRARCPHAVLISHNTTGLILPTICDFDMSLYGEGYGFGAIETYWEFFGMIKSMNAQNQVWPGSSDKSRCKASVAYNYDLLTGGGQFEYVDWRLFPEKFPYGEGVTSDEAIYVKAYNLAQYYFGIYESTPCFFANSSSLFTTSTAQTYATVYRNRVWQDYLVPVANMTGKAQTTALEVRDPEALGFAGGAPYLVYDVNARTLSRAAGDALSGSLNAIRIPKGSLKLFYIRQAPVDSACHVWGGKRISESCGADRCSVEVLAPAGVRDEVVFAVSGRGVAEVSVDGKPGVFGVDRATGLVHGEVTFAARPLTIEAVLCDEGRGQLPEKALTPDRLTMECLARISD